MTISHFKSVKTAVFAVLACGFVTSTALADAAGGIVVPSGQQLSFLEFISENEGDVVRFRFLAPQIGTVFSYLDVAADFQSVCEEQIIPTLATNSLTPTQIVLSMSAVDIPLGEPAPEVLQFFEIFRPENGLCIWEEF